jgi:transposase
MGNGVSILFGLPGVAVRRVERAADESGAAVRLAHLVTTASAAAGCPHCDVVSVSVKQRRTTWPRDLPYGEEPLAVRWRKPAVMVPWAGVRAQGVHRVHR